jgi:undecaprenyl-diphosphatase
MLWNATEQGASMSYFESAILGIIQGASEFLPISSSGHLVVARSLMGLPEIPILFDILMHLPTLLAIAIVFHRRLGELFAAFFRLLAGRRRDEDTENLRLIRNIVIATVATACVGFGFERLQSRYPISPKLIGGLFLVTAAILILTRLFRGSRRHSDLSVGHALATGAAQGFGVLPGISRSGITLSAALACGADREKAGEYTFLLAIPAVLGALVLKIGDLESMAVEPGVLFLGMACSLVIGLASLIVLLRLIRRGKLYLFSIYLIPVGIASLILL